MDKYSCFVSVERREHVHLVRIKNRFNTGEDRGENTCVELRGYSSWEVWNHHPTGKIAFLSSRNSLLLPTIYLSLTLLYLVYRRPRTATRDKKQLATPSRSIAAKKLPLVFVFSYSRISIQRYGEERR